MKRITMFFCGSSLCLLFGCMQQDQQMQKQMEANKKVAKDLWGSFSQHDAAKIASFYADSAVLNDYPVSPEPFKGRAAIQGIWQTFVTAFPDGHINFEGEIAQGDMVALQWQGTGTNTGSLMGKPPTGKSIDVHGSDILQIVNGKVVREWLYWDFAGFMKQLGMMPEPGAAAEKKEMKK